MRWQARILTTACVAAICGAANGQEIGKPAPEINAPDFFGKGKPLSIERYNGKILVLVFWRSDDKRSLESIEVLNRVHQRLEKSGVEILAITPEDKDTANKTVKDKQIRFTTGWGGGAHRTYEVSSFPRVYLIDPLGVIVWKGSPNDDLEFRIREQMLRTPPAGADAGLLLEKLDDATDLAKAGRLGRAYLIAANVAEVAVEGRAVAKKAEKLKEQLEKSAEERLKLVRDALRSSDFEKAANLAAMLSVFFKSTDVGRDAKQEIDRIRADDDGKDAFNKAVKAARASRQADRAAAMETSKQYKRAVAAYQEVVDKFPDVDAAKTSREAIERLNSDPAVKKHLKAVRADQQADRWLDIAERYDRLDMPEQAKAYYEKVVTTHPDSRAARRARKKLRG